MFFITSAYSAPPERIAAVLPAHRDWVSRLYDRGVFLLSGRLVPFSGGFMLACGVARDELDEILATDPLRLGGLLTHQVVELEPTRAADRLAFLEKDA